MQLNLLEPALRLPDGFRYCPDFLTLEEEQEFVARFLDLAFRPYEFRGYLGRRRVVSFGLHYDFGERRVRESLPLPEFLLELRDRAAAFAEIAPSSLAMALVTEYQQGAPIGWHRDRPVFGDIVGISFLSSCRFRFRRHSPHDDGWKHAERAEITLQPRSIYLLSGAARSEWEHSIPPMEQLRYSVTFRTLRANG